MKKVLTNPLFTFILGAIIFSGITYAATLLANNISYDNTDSGMNANNVQDAIDELYTKSSNNLLNDLPDSLYATYNSSSLRYGDGAVLENNSIKLGVQNAVQYGPYVNIPSGCYMVLVNGNNLDNKDLSFTFHNKNNNTFTSTVVNNVVRNENHAYYFLNLKTSTTNAEFCVYNRSTSETTIIKSVLLFNNGVCS